MNPHLLTDTPQGDAGPNEMLKVIRGLGFVQLDSINTVARAHDLILFTRKARYIPTALKTLYEQDRALFEHWTHDAAVIPMEFYPYWQLRRERDAIKLQKQWKNWRRNGFEAQLQVVLDQIREQGPLSSSDVGKDEKRGFGGWWDWHPSKTELEYLWRTGVLSVVGRDGFKKRYDLTERVLEKSLSDATNALDVEATVDWCCNGAMDRLGFASHTELAAFWAHDTTAEAKAWCIAALARGDLIQVQVESADGSMKTAFARPTLPDDAGLDAEPTSRLRVLSPFDPALRDRKRATRLFGFQYTFEMFVPEAKRKYGYYVFPLLERDRLVARVDMKTFRDKDCLHVKALWLEKGVNWMPERFKAFEAELYRLIDLAGVSKVTFEDGWLRLVGV